MAGLPIRPLPGFCIVAVACSLATAATAQVDPVTAGNAREELSAEGISRMMVSLVHFTTLPAITVSSLTIERPDTGRDSKLDGTKIPLEWDFDLRERNFDLRGILSLAHVRAHDPFDLADGQGGNVSFDVNRRVWSGMLGAGPVFEVFEDLYVAPTIIGGISNINSEATNVNGIDEVIDPVEEVFLLNWQVNAYSIAGTLEVLYDTEFGEQNDNRLEAWVQYSHAYTDAYDYPGEILNFKGHSDAVGTNVRYSKKLGFDVYGFPIGVNLNVRNVFLGGEDSSALGFNYIVGLGGGIDIHETYEQIPGEGLRLTAQALTGDNVTGFSIGVDWIF